MRESARVTVLFLALLSSASAASAAEPVQVRSTTPAEAELLAASATGEARASGTCVNPLTFCLGGVAVSGTRDARGEGVAVTGLGRATGGYVAVGSTGASARAFCAANVCLGGAAVATAGPSTGGAVAASGTGNASPSSCPPTFCPGVAASGTGRSESNLLAASVVGDARCPRYAYCVSVSVMGEASGGIAVSGCHVRNAVSRQGPCSLPYETDPTLG